MAGCRTASIVGKQLQRCLRSLRSFTDDQVRMVDCDWDSMRNLTIEISPNGGLYEGGAFTFTIHFQDSYPAQAPLVTCNTPIYHPNIDITQTDGNVCVSLFNEWTSNCELQDIIQALLFLFYHPNISDPLSELMQDPPEEEVYERRVRAIYARGENPFLLKQSAEDNTEHPDDGTDTGAGDDDDLDILGLDGDVRNDPDFFTAGTSTKESVARYESLDKITDKWKGRVESESFNKQLDVWEQSIPDKVTNESEKATNVDEIVDSVNPQTESESLLPTGAETTQDITSCTSEIKLTEMNSESAKHKDDDNVQDNIACSTLMPVPVTISSSNSPSFDVCVDFISSTQTADDTITKVNLIGETSVRQDETESIDNGNFCAIL